MSASQVRIQYLSSHVKAFSAVGVIMRDWKAVLLPHEIKSCTCPLWAVQFESQDSKDDMNFTLNASTLY